MKYLGLGLSILVSTFFRFLGCILIVLYRLKIYFTQRYLEVTDSGKLSLQQVIKHEHYNLGASQSHYKKNKIN